MPLVSMMARPLVTVAVMGQKSAKAIVGADAVPLRLDGWKQAGLARKTYPAEGPNEEQGRSPNELS
ncbi:MAG TPA: hypothetical protein HPP94_16605 [Desulfuromonadales bacterium]|nr:hypothetical protein [Desulfuromonadales bacterium]